MEEQKTKVSPYYQSQAKEIVDTLFDKNLFNEGLTRDDMQKVEDLIAFLFQSHAEHARKTAEIMLRVGKYKK